MNYKSTSAVSNLVLRIAVGLPMILIGMAEYRDFAPFVANVTDGLGALELLGTIYGHFLPALFIFGGGMLMVGRYQYITAWVGGAALGVIPAGLLLKTLMTGIPLPDMIAACFPPLIWLVAFYLALNPQPDYEVSAPAESE